MARIKKEMKRMKCPICNKGELVEGKVLMCSDIECNKIFISEELYEKLRKTYWKSRKSKK